MTMEAPAEITKEERDKMHTEGVGELTFKPEEEAAARYSYLLPIAKKLSKDMSAKAMARVVMALAEFPLQQSEKPRLISKEENQLFQVIFEINVAKGLILDYAKKVSEEATAKKKAMTMEVQGLNSNPNIVDEVTFEVPSGEVLNVKEWAVDDTGRKTPV